MIPCLRHRWLLAVAVIAALCADGRADAQRARTRQSRAVTKPAKTLKRPGIIATLGPSTANAKVLEGMLGAGMNVARINLSHNNARSVKQITSLLAKATAKTGKRVPILFDLPGGKARLRALDGAGFSLAKGDSFELTGEPGIKTSKSKAGVNYPGLAKQVKKGDRILLDDDKIVLRVTEVKGKSVKTLVETGGAMRGKMGVTVKDKELPFPAMTAQDRRKLKIAVDGGASWIGVSFVQSPANILATRRALDKLGAKNVELVAKIESHRGIKNLGAILDHVDVVMIARGDLAAAVGRENLATYQAQIAKTVRAKGKRFIVATGLMSNMLTENTPSAANIRDVQRSTRQGASWLMLNETAIGAHPVDTVRAASAFSAAP